ncbi:MAG: RdgB/HAM1 family non-canonical purine NTP pyrophosphatase [Dehalococcoidia bacterium]|nr:RdgB/HAM1 family non-canonical purine NTP pyrophosphatase [Dehalococcoidia bacterium]
MNKLLIATRNPGKFGEYIQLLAGVPFDLTSLDREGIDADVEETGNTFEENAILKATVYAKASGLLTLADDSGLEVDALAGEPGVYSARYAGPGASDEDRVRFLLDKLAGVPEQRRAAHFRCAIAIVDPVCLLKVVEGRLDGTLTTEGRGSNGFGYDPIFYVPDLDRTVAELSAAEKNAVSHRARAAMEARTFLVGLCR